MGHSAETNAPPTRALRSRQELEGEMAGLGEGQAIAQRLTRLLRKKDLQAAYVNHLRTMLLNAEAESGEPAHGVHAEDSREGGSEGGSEGSSERQRLLDAIAALEALMSDGDAQIESLIATEGNHVNRFWGYMSRAGFSDKSHLMRQIEKYADIYTSRVANLLPYTPYKKFLCQRQSLAHSMTSYSGRPLMEHWVISDSRDDALDGAADSLAPSPASHS